MALSIPERFPREWFRNSAEADIYALILEQLSDDWVVIPGIELRLDDSFAQRELDLLLLHRTQGLILVEVKGFPITIRDGRFYYTESGEVIERDPLRQVEAQRQFLAEYFRDVDEHIFDKIRIAIATPHTVSVNGNLPPLFRVEQILDSAKLQIVQDSILDLCWSTHNVAPTEEIYKTIIQRLCPTAEFDSSIAGIRAIARAKLEQRLITETQVLESLDINNRVLVTGGPGSGKTRLAVSWARRSSSRDERVLLTCYNDPLADVLEIELQEQFPDIHVHSFLRFIESSIGLPVKVSESGESLQDYWDGVLSEFQQQVHNLPFRYDTIIIDEAQDFESGWIDLAVQILDPSGPGRVFMVGDPNQNIRGTRFRDMSEDPLWSRASLIHNNRNSAAISRLLHRAFPLPGASLPRRDPFENEINFLEIADLSEACRELDAIDLPLLAEQGTSLVLAIDRSTRDNLRKQFGFVPWEDRSQGIICETVSRLKGLDATSVVLVAFGDPKNDDHLKSLLYTGISRALDNLFILASQEVLAFLGK